MKATSHFHREAKVYGLTLGLTLCAVACDHRRTASSSTASSVEPAIVGSASAPSRSAPTSVKSSFVPDSDDAISQKLAQCEPPAIDGSTRQLQGRLAKWATCVADLARNELQAINSSAGRKPLDSRGHESMVSSICRLTEDAQNFDFRADVPLLIGSLIGFTDFDCSIKASSSIYKLLSLAQSNPKLLKSCLAERQPSGVAALALMHRRFASVKAHSGATPPPFAVSDCKAADCPPYVTHEDLAKHFAKALVDIQQTAADYCASIPELIEAVRAGQCVPVLQAYFAANYEES